MSSAVVIESGGADRYQVGDDVWCTDKGVKYRAKVLKEKETGEK